MSGPDELLRPAHDAAYRFPAGFAGFTASLRTHCGGTGTVTASGRRAIDVTLPAGTPDADWVRDEVATLVSHRWSSRYEDGDGRWRKQVEGDLVTLEDDPFDSSYRVRDGHIAEVHRSAGDARFTIVVHDREWATDGRLIPVRFSAFHWVSTAGRLRRADHYCDSYTLVGGVHLPLRREVLSATDAGLATRWIDFTSHALLTP